MAESETGRIARDLMAEPHIAWSRITALKVCDLVCGRGDDPKRVAVSFDFDVADVYQTLAFYHDDPDRMERYRDERRAAYDAVDVDRPPGVEQPS